MSDRHPLGRTCGKRLWLVPFAVLWGLALLGLDRLRGK